MLVILIILSVLSLIIYLIAPKLVRFTLITNALSTLIFVSYMSITKSIDNIFGFTYVAYHSFLNTLIPLFIGVLIFSGLKKKLSPGKSIVNIFLQILILAVIFNFGLVVWALLDVISYHSGFSELTINAIIQDYNSEFIGYVPMTFISAIVIPGIDFYFFKRRENQMRIEKEKSDRISEWWDKQPIDENKI